MRVAGFFACGQVKRTEPWPPDIAGAGIPVIDAPSFPHTIVVPLFILVAREATDSSGDHDISVRASKNGADPRSFPMKVTLTDDASVNSVVLAFRDRVESDTSYRFELHVPGQTVPAIWLLRVRRPLISNTGPGGAASR
jgi:hypothetical protein